MKSNSIHMRWLPLLLLSAAVLGGPYPPRAGVAGSTAIAAGDSRIVAWANAVVDIAYGANVIDAFRTPEKALGPAVGDALDVVSLGSGGMIVLSFPNGIGNGTGYDFAVFENSFSSTFLELSYVEVSTNGADFVRFPNASLTPYPVSQYGTVDPSDVDGLAGKYSQGYGVPFDLADLAGTSADLDIARVHYVRLVDVVGDGSCFDTSGRVVYDPHPGEDSAGFDLEAVAVIHEAEPVVSANVSLRHMGFAYPGAVSGEGEYDSGSMVSWSVVNPWPSVEGKEGRRWVADEAQGTFVAAADTVIVVTWREEVLLTIQSEHGRPVGGGWHHIGTAVNWGVQTPVLATGGRTRYVSSSTSAGQVTLDGPQTITVVWETEHFLEVNRLGDGLVTPASGFYGDTVNLVASDLMDGGDTVFAFVRWEGDDVAGPSTSRDLSLSMDAPKRVMAIFGLAVLRPVLEVAGQLLPGWNLIASPLHLTDGRSNAVFGQGSVFGVYRWEPGSRRYSAEETIHRGVGYWVFAKQQTSYTWQGAMSSVAEPFATGWNLVGGNALLTTPPSVATTWAWDPAAQMYRSAGEIDPGTAYWIYVE